jgi:hypothetical protein
LNAGGFLAPIFRIARIESSGTQVSARAQIGWERGAALDIPRLLVVAQSAIASASGPGDAAATIGRGIENGGLTRVVLDGTDGFGLDGSIELAQALGPMFGLQAAGTFRRRVLGATLRDPLSGSFRDSATRYDALVDFSFEWDGDSLKVPLAAIVEYDLNARLGGTGDELLEMDSGNVHTFGLGLYYSGRKDLQVGLFGALSLNLRPVPGVADAPGFSGSPDLRVGEFVIRYIW